MEGGGEESGVDLTVSVERVDEGREVVLSNFDIFVFTLVNSAFDTVRFVVVHGVANR